MDRGRVRRRGLIRDWLDRMAQRREEAEEAKEKAAVQPPPGVERDARAYHESVWRSGNLPGGVPRPRTKKRNVNGRDVTEIVATNVLVLCMAPPGAGMRSFMNRVRFGDMERRSPVGPFAVFPPQYLCDGSVYSLALSRLPVPRLGGGLDFGDVDRMAVVIGYAADSRASMEAAQELQARLFRETLKPARPPFPVLLLGLKSDLARGGGDLADGPDGAAAAGSSRTTTTTAAERSFDRNIEGWAFAWSRNMLHAEASARTGEGVLEALGALVEEVDRERKADRDLERTAADMRNFWIRAASLVVEMAGAAEQPGEAGPSAVAATEADG